MAPARIFRFGDWEYCPDEHRLAVRGVPVRIGKQALAVLLALIERYPKVATKDDLLDAAWRAKVVEENNLSVQIAALRKALGAQAIVNVAGIGYRIADAPRSQSAPSAPAAGLLIGRDDDLRELSAMLGVAPLVTIVGSGGVGKTSLARGLLAAHGGNWRDGVHWIDLSPLRPGAPILPLVARALGVARDGYDQAQQDFFASSLAPLQALIALDNCEHLLGESADFIGPALRLAPGVRWLATSQEPLHLPGEAVYRLAPLDTPAADADPGDALQRSALRLFVDRVRRADRHFDPGGEQLLLAAEICRRLDGLPLAIEMAAARVATLGLKGVRDQLRQRLRLRAEHRDTPARQQTLLDTFEWSYALLSPVEQCVFSRLEPFLGGFDAAMALRACQGFDAAGALDDWVLQDALSALVAKSLVQRSPGAPERLYLLESARDYARLRLEAAGELAPARARHAQVLADRFDAEAADWESIRDADWSVRYMADRHNVRAALAWACETGSADIAARMVVAHTHYDAITETPGELLKAGVPPDLLRRAAPPQRARALQALGWAHYLDGNHDTAIELIRLALADCEAEADSVGCYRALATLIRLCEGRSALQDDLRTLTDRLRRIDVHQLPLRTRLTCIITAELQHGGRLITRLRELHDIAARAGFDALAGVCNVHVTDELLIQGRHAEAEAAAREMLQQGEPRPRVRALLHHNQALALVQLGRYDEARSAARAALRALPITADMVVDLFALVAAREQRHTDAALLAGYGAHVKTERNRQRDPAEAAAVAETLRLLGDVLGPERLAEWMRLGAAMPVADVLKLALGES